MPQRLCFFAKLFLLLSLCISVPPQPGERSETSREQLLRGQRGVTAGSGFGSPSAKVLIGNKVQLLSKCFIQTFLKIVVVTLLV